MLLLKLKCFVGRTTCSRTHRVLLSERAPITSTLNRRICSWQRFACTMHSRLNLLTRFCSCHEGAKEPGVLTGAQVPPLANADCSCRLIVFRQYFLSSWLLTMEIFLAVHFFRYEWKLIVHIWSIWTLERRKQSLPFGRFRVGSRQFCDCSCILCWINICMSLATFSIIVDQSTYSRINYHQKWYLITRFPDWSYEGTIAHHWYMLFGLTTTDDKNGCEHRDRAQMSTQKQRIDKRTKKMLRPQLYAQRPKPKRTDNGNDKITDESWYHVDANAIRASSKLVCEWERKKCWMFIIPTR